VSGAQDFIHFSGRRPPTPNVVPTTSPRIHCVFPRTRFPALDTRGRHAILECQGRTRVTGFRRSPLTLIVRLTGRNTVFFFFFIIALTRSFEKPFDVDTELSRLSGRHVCWKIDPMSREIEDNAISRYNILMRAVGGNAIYRLTIFVQVM